MYRTPTAPQPIGGVLDHGFALYRLSLKHTFPLALAAALVAAVIEAGMLGGIEAGARPGILISLLTSLVVLIINSLFLGAIVSRIDALMHGRAQPLGEAMSVAVNRLPAMIGAALIYTVGVSVGAVLLVVPGIFVAVAFLFFYMAVIIDRRGAVDSLQHSWKLVRGNWWRTAGFVLIVGIVVFVLYLVIAFIAGVVAAVTSGADLAAGEIPWYLPFVLMPLIAGLILPLLYAQLMSMYTDLKLRRGGGDGDREGSGDSDYGNAADSGDGERDYSGDSDRDRDGI